VLTNQYKNTELRAKIIMFHNLNKIQIHCWGGLGSQLNAWATAEAIKQKFQHKSIELVLHTGGVTKRSSEIDFLSPMYVIKIKDDFQDKPEFMSSVNTTKNLFSRVFKYLLDRFRLVLNDETDLILDRVKWWTLSVRGHYSQEVLSEQIINAMLIEIERHKKYEYDLQHKSEKILGIHYRLGDLLQLKNKTFINPEELARFTLKFLSAHEIDKTYVYSDSPNTAQISLGAYLNASTTYLDKEIWQTLIELYNHEYFIGTNSKISIWISLFRSTKNLNANVCLPVSMQSYLHQIYPEILNSKSTIFY
jgi:hypothetical protein